MQKLKILNNREKKEILLLLLQHYGFKEGIEHAMLMNEKNKLYLVNQDFGQIDYENLRINSVGLYFGELKHGELRLSIEGSQIIGKHATHHILELSSENTFLWLRGAEVPTDSGEGFVLLKHENDFLGCGKVKEGRVLNFVPKERRIKSTS